MSSLSLKLLKDGNEILKTDNLSYRIKKNNIEFTHDNVTYPSRMSRDAL